MSLENRKLFIDIKNRFAYNNTRRKACFSSGLTLKSDMLVNHVIDQHAVGRWQTTLKLATEREYIAQWCYCSLFKFMEDYKQSYEIYQRRCKKKGTELCQAISAKAHE